MAYKNDVEAMRGFVAESARKKKILEEKKSESHKDNILKNAVRQKDMHTANADRKSFMANPVVFRAIRVSAISALIFLNLFWLYSLSSSIISSDSIECPGYAKLSDFKDAEKFAEKALNGKISDKKLFVPDSSESMRRDSILILDRLKGAVVSSVVLDDCENVIFKATCSSNAETATMYIVPADNRFYVSAIELHNSNIKNN